METSIPTGEQSQQSAGSAANETEQYRSSSSRQAPSHPARPSTKSGESTPRLKLAHQDYFNRKLSKLQFLRWRGLGDPSPPIFVGLDGYLAQGIAILPFSLELTASVIHRFEF